MSDVDEEQKLLRELVGGNSLPDVRLPDDPLPDEPLSDDPLPHDPLPDGPLTEARRDGSVGEEGTSPGVLVV
jgi:hypothetical protein